MTARDLPSGTVAFAFTDVEGSTALLRELGDRWAPLLATSHALLRAAVEAAGGVVVDSEGDGAFLAFPDVRSAVSGLVAARVALLAHPWPDDAPVRVRAGVHAGHAEPVDGRYVALAVHEAARVGAVAHGGQAGAQRAGRAPPGGGRCPTVRSSATAGGSGCATSRSPSGSTTSPHRVCRRSIGGCARCPADGSLPAARAAAGRDDVLAALAEPGRLTTLVGPPASARPPRPWRRRGRASAADGVWLVPLEPRPSVRSRRPRCRRSACRSWRTTPSRHS